MTDVRVLPRDRRSIGKRLHWADRRGEWWSALAMISCGVVLALPGDSFAYPAYAAFHLHGMTETIWTCLFSACGFGRIVALIVNGYLQLATPVIRFVASFLGLMMWIACLYLFWQGTPESDGVITLVVPLFGILAAKECENIYMTAADVRIQP